MIEPNEDFELDAYLFSYLYRWQRIFYHLLNVLDGVEMCLSAIGAALT